MMPLQCRPLSRERIRHLLILTMSGRIDLEPRRINSPLVFRTRTTWEGGKPMKLSDRTALVTGGGSGIGRAIATLFAEEGARVIVNDFRLHLGEETIAAMGPGKAGAH